MPDPTTGVIAGSSLLSAGASNKAAEEQTKGTKAGLKQSAQLAGQSRQIAQNLYSQGMAQGREGLGKAYDYYRQNAGARYKPYVLGNVAAQQAIGLGAQNANNAILGLPMQQIQAQQINPDLSYMQNAPNLVAPRDPNNPVGIDVASYGLDTLPAITSTAKKGLASMAIRGGK